MTPLNELQLRRLVRKKPSLTPDGVKLLHEVIGTVAGRPDFDAVKDSSLGSFSAAGGGALSGLAPLTIAEVIDLGALKLCALPSMNKSRLAALTEALRSAAGPAPGGGAGTPGAASREARPDEPPPDGSRPPGGRPGPRPSAYSSAEADRVFSDAVSAMKGGAGFGAVADRPVGDFWDPEAVRAPFEESVTLRQLADLKAEALFKKRSFNDRKFEALLKAMRRATGGSPPVVASHGAGAGTDRADPGPAKKAAAPAWSSGSFTEAAVRVAVAATAAACSGSDGPGARLLRAVAEGGPARCFVLAYLGLDTPGPRAAPDGGDGLPGPLLLSEVLLREAPALHESWRSSLAGPGVPLDRLVGPLLEPAADPEVQTGIFRVFVRALGASPLVLAGREVPGVWSLGARVASALFSSVAARLPLSEAEVADELDALFPLFPPGAARAAFGAWAVAADGVWSRRPPGGDT